MMTIVFDNSPMPNQMMKSRQQRELGNGARGLDRRIEHGAHAAVHAHQQSDRDADHDADEKRDAEAHQADQKMMRERMALVSGLRELHERLCDGHRRRQERRIDERRPQSAARHGDPDREHCAKRRESQPAIASRRAAHDIALVGLGRTDRFVEEEGIRRHSTDRVRRTRIHHETTSCRCASSDS
jgi:hypothetical protein